MAVLTSHAPAVTRRAQRRLGVLLVLPVVVLTVVFFLLPLANALVYSVVDFDGVSPNPPFVGLANFREMFADDEVWHALSNNAIWIVIGTVAPIAIGLLIALLLWGVERGSVLYRLCFFLPYVLPGIAIGIAMVLAVRPFSTGGAIELDLDPATVAPTIVALTVLALVGSLGAIRRVLRIDPIRATTDTGSELA